MPALEPQPDGPDPYPDHDHGQPVDRPGLPIDGPTNVDPNQWARALIADRGTATWLRATVGELLHAHRWSITIAFTTGTPTYAFLIQHVLER